MNSHNVTAEVEVKNIQNKFQGIHKLGCQLKTKSKVYINSTQKMHLRSGGQLIMKQDIAQYV